MTLDDIKAIPKEFLLASDVAPYLGSDPTTIRVQAHHDSRKLGFPVVVIGVRVKIPKETFVRFFEEGNIVEQNKKAALKVRQGE